jgi:hypothetical protein
MRTTRFTGEEAHFYSVALQIARLDAFPLLGPSLTSGAAHHPGPGFFYLMSIPHFFVEAPEAANAWVEILGALSVLAIWFSLRKPFGEAGAATAGLLLAFAPWSALYADRIWNSNVVGFPIALAFLSAIQLRERPASKWVILFLFTSAVIPQFHMSAPIVWVPFLLLVRPTIGSWSRRHVAIGLALALLAYLPLFIHEATTGMGNTRAFFAETFKGGSERSYSFLLIPLYLVRFVCFDTSFHTMTGYWGGLDELAALRFLIQGNADRPFSPIWFSFLLFSLALSAAAVVVSIRHALANRRAGQPALGPFARAALAGVAADILFLGITGKLFFPPYAQPLLPFLFFPHAVLGMTMAKTRNGRVALGVLIALWAAGGAESTWAVSRNVDARNGLAVKRAVIERIHADGDAMGLRSEDPVELISPFPHHPFSMEVLSHYAFDRPLALRNGARKRRYRLVRPYDAPPPNRDPSVPPLDLGFAVLYRSR